MRKYVVSFYYVAETSHGAIRFTATAVVKTTGLDGLAEVLLQARVPQDRVTQIELVASDDPDRPETMPQVQ